jgi:hypothetical protein
MCACVYVCICICIYTHYDTHTHTHTHTHTNTHTHTQGEGFGFPDLSPSGGDKLLIKIPVDFYEQTQYFVNVSVGTPRQVSFASTVGLFCLYSRSLLSLYAVLC